jgi:hypothetical protein
MKHRLNSKILAFAVLTTIGLTATPVARANDEKSNVKTELKFVGRMNDQPVFHLQLQNKDLQEFTITIRDEYSNVLYRYNSKDGLFDKKFVFNPELGDDRLRIEINIGRKNKPVVYEINQNSRVIDEVVVNKVQ